MRTIRRLILATVIALLVVSVRLSAQTFTAEIQQFWNQLRTGVLVFTNIQATGGTLSGVTVTGGVGTFTTLNVNGLATITRNNLTTTITPGLALTNGTLATAGVPVQASPCPQLNDNVWNTTSVSNNTDQWTICSVPVSGTTPSGLLKFGSSLNGGAATYPATLSNTGLLTLLGNIQAAVVISNGDIQAQNANLIYWNGRSLMKSPADGQWNLSNDAQTAGFGLDVTTDAVAKFRTRAQTGYTTVDALGYSLSGVSAIVSGAPTVTAGFGSGTAGSILGNTGTYTVAVTIGTNAGGTTGTLTFPFSAPHGWACQLNDTTNSTDLTRQTGYSVTTAVYTTTVAWTTGDVLVGSGCGPF